jgi:hypothetical protein
VIDNQILSFNFTIIYKNRGGCIE